jgi:metallo-beta-lactamase family protein
VQKDIAEGDNIFKFPGLKETETAQESKSIVRKPNPKVILAGAGMSTGGRIVHHEKEYLSDKNNTLLITGFQTPGSLGRMIEEGAKTIMLGEQTIPVRAHIEAVKGYSGHKDSDGLVQFVSDSSKKLKKVFVAMGEMKSSLFLAQRIKEELGVSSLVPQPGEVIKISLND